MLIEGKPRIAYIVEQPNIITNLREVVMGSRNSTLYYDTCLSAIKARINISNALRGAAQEDHNMRYRWKGSPICL